MGEVYQLEVGKHEAESIQAEGVQVERQRGVEEHRGQGQCPAWRERRCMTSVTTTQILSASLDVMAICSPTMWIYHP